MALDPVEDNEIKMKTKKAYGIDLLVPINFDKIMSKKFIDMVTGLEGFIGLAPYGGAPGLEESQALVFDTPEHRANAYNFITNDIGIKVAIIMEVAEIPC